MTTVIIVLIAIAATAAAAYLLLYSRGPRPTGETPVETAARSIAPERTDPADEFRQIMDALLALNILIRKDPDLDRAILEKLERIIDDLRVVIPRMMERYPSEALTYEIKKIGETHLFRTVKEFTDLSLESRGIQMDTFTRTIDGLHEVSERSRTIVEKNETAEFKTMANFLSTKFS